MPYLLGTYFLQSPTKADGTVNNAGYVYFKAAGSSTDKDAYSDRDLTTPYSNPQVLDSNGRLSPIWLDGLYKIKIMDSTQTETVYDWVDNIGNQDLTLLSDAFNEVENGSFETAGASATLADGWTEDNEWGTMDRVNTEQRHGAWCFKFVTSGSGGGQITQTNFAECNPDRNKIISFALYCTAANIRVIAKITWYDESQASISTTTLYDDQTTNPTSWALKGFLTATPPSGARYYKFTFIGGDSSNANSGTCYVDNIVIYDKLNTASSITLSKTASYSVDATTDNHAVILVDDSSGDVTITLDTEANHGDGGGVTVIKVAGTNSTIVDDDASAELARLETIGDAVEYVTDGTSWYRKSDRQTRMFRVIKTADQTVSSSATDNVTWNTEDMDYGGDFTLASDYFQAPYDCLVVTYPSPKQKGTILSNFTFQIQLYDSGTTTWADYGQVYYNPAFAVSMASGDRLRIQVTNGATTTQTVAGSSSASSRRSEWAGWIYRRID